MPKYNKVQYYVSKFTKLTKIFVATNADRTMLIWGHSRMYNEV